MKKISHLVIFFLLIIFSFTLCKKKEESSPSNSSNPTPASTTSNPTPTFVVQVTGTSLNPCLPCVTITGTNIPGNTATQNSALTVGGAGWSFNSCATSVNILTAYNGPTQVQIQFGGGPIISGTYAFTSGIPTAGQARMTVYDAPGQPSGIVWYSKNGSVSVTTGTSGTMATFSNITCVQLNYLFPVVTVSGSLNCI